MVRCVKTGSKSSFHKSILNRCGDLDRVAVERAGETANLRRVSDAYCEEANARAVAAVAEESAEDATECYAAKEAVVNASTVEEAELAALKMRLLCDD